MDDSSWRNVCTYSTKTQGSERWVCVGHSINISGTFTHLVYLPLTQLSKQVLRLLSIILQNILCV